MRARVLDADGRELPFFGGTFRLQEKRTYRLELSPGGLSAEVLLGERRLTRESGGGFSFSIDHWVGVTALRVVTETAEHHLPVRVLPRREKLSEGAWVALLEDLERWVPGLTTGIEGGLAHDVRLEGGHAPLLAMALLPLLPALVRAVKKVARAPRQQTESFPGEVPMHMVRRADRETLSWLSRHPGTARAVDRWYQPMHGGRELHLPQRLTRDTIDHPANRYVAWLLVRVSRRLNDLAGVLEKAAAHPDGLEDTAAWCRARAAAMRHGAEQLDALLRRSCLRELNPQPATEAALVTVRNDPAYGRVHILARRFLAPRLSLEQGPDGVPAPVRPSFSLYELWTFLAMQRLLEGALPGVAWRWHPSRAPEYHGGFGSQSRFSAELPGQGRLELIFNLTFPGWLATTKRQSPARWSVSRERRPDLVLTWDGLDGGRAWVCFDAKYRVHGKALAESFSSLHLYRDSLHWPAYGGQCRGGLLLVPAQAEECTPWFEREFLERFGVGAVTLAPGNEAASGLTGWIGRTLGITALEVEGGSEMQSGSVRCG